MKNNFNNSPDLLHIKSKPELIKITKAVLCLLEKEHGGIYFNSENGDVNFEKCYNFREIYDYLNNLVCYDADQILNNNPKGFDYRKIFKDAAECSNTNNICLTEAILIMLQIVHSFKIEMEHSEEWFKKNNVNRTPVYLPYLLLSVLHEINGSSARLRDLDPDWEDRYEKILNLPNFSFDLDASITQFLLLPLYTSTHPHLVNQ